MRRTGESRGLPRTTERPARECGDEPCSNCGEQGARVFSWQSWNGVNVPNPEGHCPKAMDVSPWYGVYSRAGEVPSGKIVFVEGERE